MKDNLDFKERLWQMIPYPLSVLAYKFGRTFIRKDLRSSLYDKAFLSLLESKTKGDFLEFGVYRGTSFISNWYLAKKYAFNDMRFIAFDCFDGLPETEGPFEKDMYACSRPRFLSIIRKAGVDLKRVGVVEGLYEESLTSNAILENNLDKAAIVHVDCDLYSSTKLVLNFIEPLIQKGTIILFDDWFDFANEQGVEGEPQAFAEWPQSERFELLYKSNQHRGFICVKE